MVILFLFLKKLSSVNLVDRLRLPPLATPTLKPRFLCGGVGGLYHWTNIPPTASEPRRACGCWSQRTPQGKSRSGRNAWPVGFEPGTWLWYQLRPPPLATPTLKPRC